MTEGGVRIAEAILAARSARRPALAAYLTAGFPSRGSFPATLRATAVAADVIEVGVPFSDPIADGVTIQRASRVAIAGGVTLRWTFQMLAAAGCSVPAPIVLMSYVNPLLQYGFERAASDAARAGISGFIVPDLPLDEQGPLAAAVRARGLALVQMATPASAPARLARIGAISEGFVYAVTIDGTTGGRLDGTERIAAYLDRVRASTSLPILAGFGVAARADVAALVPPADGVVVGSALIARIERGESPGRFLEGLLS